MKVIDYIPQMLKVPPNDEDLDVDGTNDGDFIVCPIHEDEIVYVMGPNTWPKEDQSFGWTTTIVRGYCHQCRKHHLITLGSYGG